MSTKLPAAKALEFIDYYQLNLPAGSLKSALLNRDIIDAIIALNATHQLDGLRVYLARYSENDTGGRYTKDVDTIIVVPTEETQSAEGQDIETEYHNYARLCPPYCGEG